MTNDESAAQRARLAAPEAVDSFLDYFRVDERLPHILCPGCGIGTAMNTVVRSFIETGVNQDELCVVSGIGCSSRISGYLDCDTFHTLHGRALPAAPSPARPVPTCRTASCARATS